MSNHPSRPAHPAHPVPPGYAGAPARPAAAGRVLRLLALTAVGIGVIVLAAAAFLLSYPGIHAIALQAGVSASLARGYPVIFDAILVIACAAVLSLRGAGVVSRCYAWLCLLVLLAAAAGADALHSTGTRLPHRPAAAAAAIIPWALLLIGFGLLLAMLRHARLHRAAAAGAAMTGGLPAPYRAAGPPQIAAPPPWGAQPGPLPYGMGQPAAGLPQTAVPAPPGPALAGPPSDAALSGPPPSAAAPSDATQPDTGPSDAGPGSKGGAGPQSGALGVPRQMIVRDPAGDRPEPAGGEPDQGPELALDADPDQDDPSTDEAAYLAAPEASAAGAAGAQAHDEEPGDAGAKRDAPLPAFHRMWSSPTPPGDDYDG